MYLLPVHCICSVLCICSRWSMHSATQSNCRGHSILPYDNLLRFTVLAWWPLDKNHNVVPPAVKSFLCLCITPGSSVGSPPLSWRYQRRSSCWVDRAPRQLNNLNYPFSSYKSQGLVRTLSVCSAERHFLEGWSLTRINEILVELRRSAAFCLRGNRLLSWSISNVST